GVHLYVKVRTHNAPPGDAINLAVQICGGMPVGGDRVRRQTSIVSVGGRVVAPEGSRWDPILVDPSQQVKIGAITDRGERVASGGQGSNRVPAIGRGHVLVSGCGGGARGAAAKGVDVISLGRRRSSGDRNWVRRSLGPGAAGGARGRGGGWGGSGRVDTRVQIACTSKNRRWRICLATASPSRGGRSQHGQRESTKADYDAKQNAQIQESGSSSAFLFH